jgi:hypothetical protein
MIHTLNEQMGYIMDLEKYMGTIPTPGLKDILECNKLMMEIINPLPMKPSINVKAAKYLTSKKTK